MVLRNPVQSYFTPFPKSQFNIGHGYFPLIFLVFADFFAFCLFVLLLFSFSLF